MACKSMVMSNPSRTNGPRESGGDESQIVTVGVEGGSSEGGGIRATGRGKTMGSKAGDSGKGSRCPGGAASQQV